MKICRLSMVAALVVASLLCVASDVPPPEVPAPKVPLSLADQQISQKFTLDRIKMDILPGDPLGHYTSGFICGGYEPLVATEVWLHNYPSFVYPLLLQELRRLKYPIAGLESKSAFDLDVNAAPDFHIGAVVRAYNGETCIQNGRADGWIYVKVDWALYSERQQRVVFQKVTEGLSVSRDKTPDLSKNAVLASFDNFLAEPGLLDAIRQAGDSAGTASQATTNGTPLADDTLVLVGAGAPHGGAQKNMAQLRAAVVQVETLRGLGSAFYIDKAGYLLTDFHVVSDTKFAKVKLPNGDKLVAEVLRVDDRHDVALLKTQAVDVTPLSVRRTPIDVGADVYVIGSPSVLGPTAPLANTLTRGVLSAIRKLDGRRVLQSDAAINHGNSGGPMLDQDGSVVGLADYIATNDVRYGFFTPVDDALAALHVVVK